MAKKILKKVVANVIMALAMMLIGFSIGTAMYSAGFKFNLPKISINWSNENHDLILIDRAAINKSDSNNRVSGDDALASN